MPAGLGQPIRYSPRLNQSCLDFNSPVLAASKCGEIPWSAAGMLIFISDIEFSTNILPIMESQGRSVCKDHLNDTSTLPLHRSGS